MQPTVHLLSPPPALATPPICLSTPFYRFLEQCFPNGWVLVPLGEVYLDPEENYERKSSKGRSLDVFRSKDILG